MSYIFSGKRIVIKKEDNLQKKIAKIKKEGTIPQLVIFQIGKNLTSDIFLREKLNVAKRVGIKLVLIRLTEDSKINHIAELIKKENINKKVHGVMVQLPLPKNFSKKDRDYLINTISKEKDVDGMRGDSGFVTPVVKAVMFVIEEAFMRARPFVQRSGSHMKIFIVGERGFVGKKISSSIGRDFKRITGIDFMIIGCNSSTSDLNKVTKKGDVLISATGVSGLIRGDMVKKGAIVIDVGSPKGDVNTLEVSQNASFISPVPGGVGPLTVYYLMENLIEACLHSLQKIK